MENTNIPVSSRNTKDHRSTEHSDGYALVKVDSDKNRYHPLCFKLHHDAKVEEDAE